MILGDESAFCGAGGPAEWATEKFLVTTSTGAAKITSRSVFVRRSSEIRQTKPNQNQTNQSNRTMSSRHANHAGRSNGPPPEVARALGLRGEARRANRDLLIHPRRVGVTHKPLDHNK
jgi:hypothetical protein